MPVFQNQSQKDEHWGKHGQGLMQNENAIAAYVFRVMLKHSKTPAWDADAYEWLGGYVLENGLPHARGGGWIQLPQDKGFLVAYSRKNHNTTYLTTLFHANSIDAKMEGKFA